MIVKKYDTSTKTQDDESSKKSTSSSKRKSLFTTITLASIFILTVFTAVFATTVYDFTWENAQGSFENETKSASSSVNGQLSEMVDSTKRCADELVNNSRNGESINDVIVKIQEYSRGVNVKNLKIFSSDKVYNMSGMESISVPDVVKEARANGTIAASTFICYDADLGADALVVYVPINNSTSFSGVMSVISADTFYKNISIAPNSEIAGYLVDSSGKVIYTNVVNEKTGDTVGNLLLERVGQAGISELNASLTSHTALTRKNLGSGKAMLTYQPVGNDMSWGIVNVKNTSNISGDFNNVLTQIFIIGFSLIALVLILLIYIWTSERRHIKQIERSENLDSAIGCYNFESFHAEVNAVLHSKKNTPIAILYLGILNYEYVNQAFGQHIGENCLRYFYNSISRVVQKDELIGRASQKRFVVMLNYTTEEELLKRYEMIYQYIYNYLPLREKGITLNLYAGIAVSDVGEQNTAAQLIDMASIAFKATTMANRKNYKIYNNELKESFSNKAVIESTMKAALENEEFELFLQPKYNIKKNVIDSAEALVRWNHPTKGMVMPSEYIPLFEGNGFVVEIDKYIYIKSLIEIRKNIDSGRGAVPFSINVSRVTAIQPEFLKFYIENKNKYNIPDGFIEIEFTESFALESYNTINTIVTALKKNGVRTAIDDFGSGYSFFMVLKQLEMDVIKMDSFFLLNGKSKKRDEILIAGVVNIAKDLGMTVVQEGIETKQQFEHIKALGCDVVQGYWYSRPLSTDDFEVFLKEKGKMDIEQIN